jgi:hypothetical protein
MIGRAETRIDGTTLVVRIPMRFQRRGGRKRIVAPDGSEIAPATKPQPDGTLVKALARAWRWQRMLEESRFASIRELAEAERVGVVRCPNPAPDSARVGYRRRDLGRAPGTTTGGADAAVPGRVGAAAGTVLMNWLLGATPGCHRQDRQYPLGTSRSGCSRGAATLWVLAQAAPVPSRCRVQCPTVAESQSCRDWRI